MQAKLIVHKKSNGNYELRLGRKYLMSCGKCATVEEFLQHLRKEARATKRKGESRIKAAARRYEARERIKVVEHYLMSTMSGASNWTFTAEQEKAIDEIVKLATGCDPNSSEVVMEGVEEPQQTRAELLQEQFKKLKKQQAHQLAQEIGVRFVKVITSTFVSADQMPHLNNTDEIQKHLRSIGLFIPVSSDRVLQALVKAGDAARRLLEVRQPPALPEKDKSNQNSAQLTS